MQHRTHIISLATALGATPREEEEEVGGFPLKGLIVGRDDERVCGAPSSSSSN